ncbi:MAG TPA: beta-ketoacyl-[acyl-carrier-protein] synthase family protein [Fimbriiglobus sp.]|nr:beta-ketoacyl-[acyl-carrier-protein] synthase family protein [Fimbriiglobus sp.]
MPSTSRRAVFTGLGVFSPVGSGAEAFWQALRAGACGVHTVRSFDASALACHVAGEVADFDAKKVVPKEHKKRLNQMGRAVQLGLCAAYRAWEDAKGPQKGQIDPFRYGVEFACMMVATELEDLARASKVSLNGTPGSVNMAVWGRDGLRDIPPQWMLKYLPNMPACHTSILVDAQGPNNSITSGDVAGLLALGEAYRAMNRDLADAFLVGGCESKINPLSFTRHNTFQPLTRRNDIPEQALRPFDSDRDGTVLGEGAAAVSLESLDFAKGRGAAILAELVGFAAGFDRGRKGPVLAGVIRNALKEAGIQPSDVDHVNAGASGSKELDAFEARAIAEVFGDSIPVYAARPHFGSMGAASGLVELTASILALRHGELPGTLNHEKPDPACPIQVHTGAPRSVTKPYVVKLSYTDMGQCAAVVVRKWDE